MIALPASFFRRPVEAVARDLLGATLLSRCRGPTGGVIVEVEAYLGRDDPASHAWRGRRHPGNENLYGPPGTWYVYRSYGIHWCANLVCAGPAPGSAVLLRGFLPERGLPLIRRRRGAVAERELANGPGKLCQALGITRALDGAVMRSSAVVVGKTPKRPAGIIRVTPRIGISRATDWPLRFVLVPPGL